MKFEIAPKSTEITATWNDAKMYCFALNVDGKTGWRLPTMAELNEIYESENDFERYWYWSSNEHGNEGYVHCKGFYDGYQGSSRNGMYYHFRAIRDLP